jgi:hypothetical protein
VSPNYDSLLLIETPFRLGVAPEGTPMPLLGTKKEPAFRWFQEGGCEVTGQVGRGRPIRQSHSFKSTATSKSAVPLVFGFTRRSDQSVGPTLSWHCNARAKPAFRAPNGKCLRIAGFSFTDQLIPFFSLALDCGLRLTVSLGVPSLSRAIPALRGHAFIARPVSSASTLCKSHLPVLVRVEYIRVTGWICGNLQRLDVIRSRAAHHTMWKHR